MRLYSARTALLLLLPLLVEHVVPAASAATEPKYGAAALQDEVSWNSLPGAGDLGDIKTKFRMFAGYLPINQDSKDASQKCNAFYWFFESQKNTKKDPLMLWTNGGPGCSGLLGLLTEHGPFLVRQNKGDIVLKTNPSSWNTAVNMLYIEAPCGVGFSYRKGAQYDTGDARTARDNAALLQTFLGRYPHLRGNDLHIASESYGGHYMPTLALEILRQNDATKSKADRLNLKGILLGNPYVDYGSNEIAYYDKLWGVNVVSKALYQTWRSKCAKGLTDHKSSGQCAYYEYQMSNQLGTINPYALDYPICNIGGQTSPQGLQLMKIRDKMALGAQGVGPGSQQPAYAQCAGDYLGTYLNKAAVKSALHAKASIKWALCSDPVTLGYSFSDYERNVIPLYKQILDEHPEQRILIFSGDNDAVCATSGTQSWIYGLGRRTVSLWQQWRLDGQPAGYATKFSGGALAFVTVHSAGHEVPAYQPERALVVLQRYLDGSWFAKRGKRD
eukprot:TRINITY_DN627_c0_g2_i1.p1 TRINITY_DN627_c0_g2~~TRINITY_DN627_c0_g2_i1.p1  ORF type:complete len:501 (-),score=144.66 TRINITY_DN627_c0_g2_i1:1049-2551(-)